MSDKEKETDLEKNNSEKESVSFHQLYLDEAIYTNLELRNITEQITSLKYSIKEIKTEASLTRTELELIALRLGHLNAFLFVGLAAWLAKLIFS